MPNNTVPMSLIIWRIITRAFTSPKLRRSFQVFPSTFIVPVPCSGSLTTPPFFFICSRSGSSSLFCRGDGSGAGRIRKFLPSGAEFEICGSVRYWNSQIRNLLNYFLRHHCFSLLQDQYDQIAVHTQKGIDFLEKYGNFVDQRCRIEQEYASKLRYVPTQAQTRTGLENRGTGNEQPCVLASCQCFSCTVQHLSTSVSWYHNKGLCMWKEFENLKFTAASLWNPHSVVLVI